MNKTELKSSQVKKGFKVVTSSGTTVILNGSKSMDGSKVGGRFSRYHQVEWFKSSELFTTSK